jgi:hypothetical protein
MRYGISMPNFGEYGDARLLAELARTAAAAGWDGFSPDPEAPPRAPVCQGLPAG